MNMTAYAHATTTALGLRLGSARFVDVVCMAVTGPVAPSTAGAGVRRSLEEGPPRDRRP